jgi:hypothetical protein
MRRIVARAATPFRLTVCWAFAGSVSSVRKAVHGRRWQVMGETDHGLPVALAEGEATDAGHAARCADTAEQLMLGKDGRDVGRHPQRTEHLFEF